MSAVHEQRVPDPRIRLAATVMLLRESAAGPEVFVLQRVASMAFAAGMTAFPGGGVDERDRISTDWLGPDAAWFGDRFAVEPDIARAVVVAAVREVFEETGVLLADLPQGSPARDPLVLEQQRQLITDHRVGIDAVGATVRADLLRPWARWLTPPGQSRRYDTFFFTALARSHGKPALLTTEAEIGRWVRPQAALDAGCRNEIALMPPTVAMLTDLAELTSAEQIMRIDRRVCPVSPRVVSEAGESLVVRVDGQQFRALGFSRPG